ncbi:MAG: protein kinase [Myxococcales bacterium]|nr:protein kinase [Myxococcales bacterium]
MPLEPNALVTPSLRLVRQLGAGGMGAVWVARHLGLKCDVVVKFILGDHAKNPDAVARFEREAAAAADVKSPHVVHMIDHGVSQQGLPYIAMELLEGEDLATRIERQGRLRPGEVAAIVQQVARALARAHERGIVHRDIKPENIFLCETGEDAPFVKVVDFGIAKVITGGDQVATKTGSIIGSPYYMSPEQMMGDKALDHRTDLWSLGVVAFYALTGRRPFSSDMLGALAVMICSGKKPVPSAIAPDVPPGFDAWFEKACAQSPAERFQSARALADGFVMAVGAPSEAWARVDPLAPSPRGTEIAALAPTELQRGTPAPAATLTMTHLPLVTEEAGPSRIPASKRRSTRLVALVATVLLLGGAAAYRMRSPAPPTPSTATPTTPEPWSAPSRPVASTSASLDAASKSASPLAVAAVTSPPAPTASASAGKPPTIATPEPKPSAVGSTTAPPKPKPSAASSTTPLHEETIE